MEKPGLFTPVLSSFHNAIVCSESKRKTLKHSNRNAFLLILRLLYGLENWIATPWVPRLNHATSSVYKGAKDFTSLVNLKGLDVKLDLDYLAYFAKLSLNLKYKADN